MKFSLYLFVATFAQATAKFDPGALPNEVSDARKALVTRVVDQGNGLAPTALTPCANNALWQEAVANDLAVGNGSNANRDFYSLVVEWQRLENSSQSYMPDGLISSSTFSQALQKGAEAYPTEFNRAQALTSQSKSSLLANVPRSSLTLVW